MELDQMPISADPVSLAMGTAPAPPSSTPAQVTEPSSLIEDDEIIQDDDFSYAGLQVVRGEFFAHVNEPSITFSQKKVYFNMACLRRLPEFKYVQFMVNPDEKKLVVQPCSEDEKDAIAWVALSSAKRKPKKISCKVFFSMIVNLMEWNANYRYKLLGKIIRSRGDLLIVYDLNSYEMYRRIVKENGKVSSSRQAVFQSEWENQFGLPYEEHSKLLQINIFDGYTVFSLQEQERQAQDDSEKNIQIEGDASWQDHPSALTSALQDQSSPLT